MYAKQYILKNHPELEENSELIEKHFEKKYGFKPPLSYNELIRRPKPDELPNRISERMSKKKEIDFYNDF